MGNTETTTITTAKAASPNAGRSKTEFRAKREIIGLTQADIAEELGVGLKTVKRWESEGYRNPSDEAWALIDREYEVVRKTIANAVRTFTPLKENDGASSPIRLAYYRSQEQYEELSPIEGNYLRVNASMRVTAIVLESLGIEATFVPTDGLAEIARAKGYAHIGGDVWETEDVAESEA